MKTKIIICSLSAALVTFGAFSQTQSGGVARPGGPSTGSKSGSIGAANATTGTGGATVGSTTTASGQAPANIGTNVNSGVNGNVNANPTPPEAAAGVNGNAVVTAAGTVDAGGNPQMFIGGTDTGGGNIINATDPRNRTSPDGRSTNNIPGVTNNFPGVTNRGAMSRPSGRTNNNTRVFDNATGAGGGVNMQKP